MFQKHDPGTIRYALENLRVTFPSDIVMARECGPPRWVATMDKRYFVYILASRRNGTPYIGMTNNLIKRVWEHREGLIPGFTKKYGVNMLVHYEVFEMVRDAINRETRLKKWKREWKINLIQQTNHEWNDLYQSFLEERRPTWVARGRGP
jgi:putative endonuclease